MSDGRPLRFLGLTLGGWTAIRVAMLWPAVGAPAVATVQAPGPSVASPTPVASTSASASAPAPPGPAGREAAAAWPLPAPPADRSFGQRVPFGGARPGAVMAAAMSTTAAPIVAPSIVAPPTNGMPLPASPALPPPLSLPLPSTPIAPTGSGRWTASAWLIARDGARGALQGGQLGDSQAGVRTNYALDAARRLALTARMSAPLSGRGAEAALGVAWRPPRLPVQIIAEQRIGLDGGRYGGRGGPTLLAAGGIGPTGLAAGATLEAYAQAGLIVRDGGEGFADAAARVVRPIASPGGLRIDLGAGAWGGAQRGTERLDIGPTLGVAVPAGGARLRLTFDWRVRVAGRAAPGSGPALSLGTDF